MPAHYIIKDAKTGPTKITISIQKTQVVLVDEKDKVLGLKEKLATHKLPVPLHRAISIVIFNKDRSKILITKRASVKPAWPNFWTNAVCSPPYPEETYAKAAKRRLFEEPGIKTPSRKLSDLPTRHK